MSKSNLCLNVTLVRHAQTELSARRPRVMSGQGNHSLTPDGLKQAKALALQLSKTHYSHIYTSDQLQAKMTCLEIKALQPQALLMEDKRLREQDIGQLSGVSWVSTKDFLKSLQMRYDDYLSKNAEDLEHFDQRVMDFYADVVLELVARPHYRLIKQLSNQQLNTLELEQKLAQVALQNHDTHKSTKKHSAPATPAQIRMPLRNILIVTHGGWIDSLMRQLIEDLHFEIASDSLSHGFPQVASIYQFKIYKDRTQLDDYEWRGKIDLMNSKGHLAKYRKRTDSSLKKTQLRSSHPDLLIKNASETSLDSNGSSVDTSPNLSPATRRKNFVRMFGFKGSKTSTFFKTTTGVQPSSPLVGSPLRRFFDKSKGNSQSSPTCRGSPKVRQKTLGW